MSEAPSAALLLYVEDEVLIQDVLVSSLTEAGYEVLAVTTATEGINALQSRTGELRGLGAGRPRR